MIRPAPHTWRRPPGGWTSHRTGQPIAFFDVDETLLAGKSMFDFLRYHRRQGAAPRIPQPAPASQTPRAELNRAYYRSYAGESWADLLTEGRAWYAGLCRRPRPFLSGGLAALRRHKTAGHAIVLVSGSFLPCLGPLARHVGADSMVCARPVVTALGTLTGEISQPVIGPAKGAAVHRITADWRVRPDDCFAYADHASDLELLTAVGNPRVIGDDPVLRMHAGARGWPVLPAEPVAAPPEGEFTPPECYCGCALAGGLDIDTELEGMTS